MHELKVDYSDDKKFVRDSDEDAKSALVDRKEGLLSVQDAADRIKACLRDGKSFVNRQEAAEHFNSAQKDISWIEKNTMVCYWMPG